MLKIRLQRVGRINSPSYRVIVAEHARGPKTGNFVEVVGTYNPKTKDRVLNADRIKYWISVGAKPSDTMHNMLISAGVTSGKKINVLPTIVVAPVVEETPAVAPEAAPADEAPVVEETPVSGETPVEEVVPTPAVEAAPTQ
jgi:small subunit ribosomal protein S16